ncbi:uncharacterized protein LOC121240845 [Juglans microcarpa x Juglans regia]|uniref:uncharacterized protein LOC121240845 n=1 Tax=Juglans microcarpa x Juglans regia TaxID=2249226 RepID=UPI001B7E5438|nr:uncharacterized protein LOC121240845 [Juglans microcarpa x Juglans regia]
MSYARWTDVPKSIKDELIDRVRGDFELDWELKNHRLAVWKQLRKRFNAFHDELHKKYLAYASHDEALPADVEFVDPIVWAKLCGRWGSDAFKRSEGANLVDFYKEVRWSKKKDKFVTDATEDIYKEMAGKMDELAPENHSDEATRAVSREVLGHRLGYARGLGEMVILESTRAKDRERDKEYAMLVERYKKDADDHKSELDRVREEMRVVVERQIESKNMLRSLMASFHSHARGSLRGTQ